MTAKIPTIVSRSDWEAKKPKGRITGMSRHDFIVVHHAAGYQSSTLEEGQRQMREIQKLHQDKNGWIDVGYQFIIDSAGNIYQGRPYVGGSSIDTASSVTMGAHVAKQNTGKIGICLLGCFHPPVGSCDDKLTKASRETLISLLAFFCKKYEIKPSKIKGHRDFLSTKCPGDNIYSEFASIRSEVAKKL